MGVHMQILLGLRDFGKIKSAEVDIGGFSVFVGNNNSGKTYVMQLIYGIRKNLGKYLEDGDLYERDLVQMEEQAKAGKITLDAESMKTLEKFLNAVLQKYKEKIILDTFYEKIEIGQISLRYQLEENESFELDFTYEYDEKLVLGFTHLTGGLNSVKDMRSIQIDVYHTMNETKLMKSYGYFLAHHLYGLCLFRFWRIFCLTFLLKYFYQLPEPVY